MYSHLKKIYDLNYSPHLHLLLTRFRSHIEHRAALSEELGLERGGERGGHIGRSGAIVDESGKEEVIGERGEGETLVFLQIECIY